MKVKYFIQNIIKKITIQDRVSGEVQNSNAFLPGIPILSLGPTP